MTWLLYDYGLEAMSLTQSSSFICGRCLTNYLACKCVWLHVFLPGRQQNCLSGKIKVAQVLLCSNLLLVHKLHSHFFFHPSTLFSLGAGYDNKNIISKILVYYHLIIPTLNYHLMCSFRSSAVRTGLNAWAWPFLCAVCMFLLLLWLPPTYQNNWEP